MALALVDLLVPAPSPPLFAPAGETDCGEGFGTVRRIRKERSVVGGVSLTVEERVERAALEARLRGGGRSS